MRPRDHRVMHRACTRAHTHTHTYWTTVVPVLRVTLHVTNKQIIAHTTTRKVQSKQMQVAPLQCNQSLHVPACLWPTLLPPTASAHSVFGL